MAVRRFGALPRSFAVLDLSWWGRWALGIAHEPRIIVPRPLLVKVIRSRAFGGRFESRLAVAVQDRGGRRARGVSFGRRRVLALPLASLGAGQQRAAIAGWAQERRRAARGVGAC